MEGKTRITMAGIILLAGLLLLPQAAEAIAIAPGNINAEFAPNQISEYEIIIINNAPQANEIKLYKKGPLAGYLELPSDSLALGANKEERIKIKVHWPAALPKGDEARIGAAVKTGGGQISAVAAVETIFRIGSAGNPTREIGQNTAGQQSAEIALLGVSISKSDGGAKLEVNVRNSGNAGADAYAEAKIEADTGAGDVKTASKPVPAGEEETLTAELNSVLAKASDYKIDVVVYFGKSSVKKSVRVSSGVTGSSVTDVPASSPKLDFLLIAAIVFIIIIDAAVFVWRKLQKSRYR
ncbi:MAG: hypothetical protein HYT16_00305 [DPANN group archaeon]|nr:hypothetical protein [DPANN group archaeon]